MTNDSQTDMIHTYNINNSMRIVMDYLFILQHACPSEIDFVTVFSIR